MRLFVAAYPTGDWAERASDAAAAWASGLGLKGRATAAEAVHLTLQFVGEIDPRQLDVVEESVERACSGMSGLWFSADRLEVWPARGEARTVVAAGEASAGVVELHRRLASRLARNPRARGGGGFEPHVTLVRLEPGSRAPVERVCERAPERWTIGEVRLMRSVLKPSGAEHALVRGYPVG